MPNRSMPIINSLRFNSIGADIVSATVLTVAVSFTPFIFWYPSFSPVGSRASNVTFLSLNNSL